MFIVSNQTCFKNKQAFEIWKRS